MRVECAGKTQLTVLANRSLMVDRRWDLQAGSNHVTLELPAARWTAALKRSSGPERLLAVSVSGLVECSDPGEGGSYPFADALLAGFAHGE